MLSTDEGKSVRWPDLTGFRNVGLGNRKDLKRQQEKVEGSKEGEVAGTSLYTD